MTDDELREKVELKLYGYIVSGQVTEGILRKGAEELIALVRRATYEELGLPGHHSEKTDD